MMHEIKDNPKHSQEDEPYPVVQQIKEEDNIHEDK